MLPEIILVLLAIPVGFLVAWLARDELVQGRKWFLALTLVFLIVAVVFFGLGMNTESFTSVFIAIVSKISYWKSFDKNWTKGR